MPFVIDSSTGSSRWLDQSEVAAYTLQAGESLSDFPAAPVVTVQQIDDAVTQHLNAAAQRKGYADAATCISYIGDPVVAWDADGKAMKQWRSDAWTTTFAQEAISPLPSVATVLAAIDALASNPKW